MAQYVVNRPDPAAMERILAANPDNAAGTVLRLALWAGLTRDEIAALRWSQVNFPAAALELPDRTIPLAPELAEYLQALSARQGFRSERVLLSDRDAQPPSPPSISRLARTALDAGGQTAVRLIDLRHAFILRQLQEHDWQYVSRVSGDQAAALIRHYGPELGEKVSTRARSDARAPRVDEFRLWKLLQDQRLTPGGVTLWLTWKAGLQLGEIVTLRWSQVDWAASRVRLEERTVPLPGGVTAVLRDLREKEPDTEYVVVAPRSRRPYDASRLSRLTRSLLIGAGMDDLTLRDLRQDCAVRAGGETAVLTYLRTHRSITRAETMKLLGLSRTTAYYRLQQMVQRGRLTQVGARYYLKDTVVPPDRQAQTIITYLQQEGFAYRQDIARILQIEPRQCGPILRRLVADGTLIQQSQRYCLKREA